MPQRPLIWMSQNAGATQSSSSAELGGPVGRARPRRSSRPRIVSADPLAGLGNARAISVIACRRSFDASRLSAVPARPGSPSRRTRAAAMKSRNSGWAWVGFDLNSGWNWTARNQDGRAAR